jgi:hypothetical protein
MDKHFATNIAPYAPPPDQADNATSNGHPRASWFQRPGGAAGGYSSYQSGGIPTFGGEQTGITGFGGGGGIDEEQGPSNLWETRFGWRVDIEAAVAYLFGPVSGEWHDYKNLVQDSRLNDFLGPALALLILETSNDYVRFHGETAAATSRGARS